MFPYNSITTRIRLKGRGKRHIGIGPLLRLIRLLSLLIVLDKKSGGGRVREQASSPGEHECPNKL